MPTKNELVGNIFEIESIEKRRWRKKGALFGHLMDLGMLEL